MAGLIIFFRGGGPQGGVYASGAGSACASLALSALVGLSGVSASAASVAISGSMALTGAAGSSSTAAPSLALKARPVRARRAGQLGGNGRLRVEWRIAQQRKCRT